MGCYKMVDNYGYCELHSNQKKELPEHKFRKPFENAERPNKELYQDKRWYAIRRDLVREGATCMYCGASSGKENRLEVHHIQRPKGNEDLFFNRSNLLVICHKCHLRITGRESNY